MSEENLNFTKEELRLFVLYGEPIKKTPFFDMLQNFNEKSIENE
jgi:hypothetical protein